MQRRISGMAAQFIGDFGLFNLAGSAIMLQNSAMTTKTPNNQQQRRIQFSQKEAAGRASRFHSYCCPV
jgi:hypothetical protein